MPLKIGREQKLIGTVVSAVVVLGLTAALVPFRPYLNSTEVALALLLVVLITSTVFGSRAGLAASFVGILCFNFFFLPPYYTFTIADPQNWVAFGVFIITALIAGQVSGYASRRAEEAEAQKLEIERLYKELQEAFEKASDAEALRRSEKLKSSLLDAVTHDLRTPLTSIKASVTTLIDTTGGAELNAEDEQELLAIINEETDRLDEFIESIVGVAKLEARALGLRRRASSVDEIVSAAISRIEHRASDRAVNIEIASDLPNVFVDAESMSKVVHTIVDNAVKYSPKDSQVLISAIHSDLDEVLLSIQDQGKGIEPEFRETVFSKFYRGENDQTSGSKGLGLGLAFARGIAESQGSHIYIEDGDTGFATKFVISLPVNTDEYNAE